jgi:hypothetical protein
MLFSKALGLRRTPVFVKQRLVESIRFKYTFLDGPFSHTYCGKGFLATCLVQSNIIDQYTCILTNNAQELTSYRSEFKCP